MKFEQQQPNKKAKGLTEKAKDNLRKAGLALGIGGSAVVLGAYGHNEYFTDYSNLPTKREALKQAKEDKKSGFMYKGKSYTVENLEDRFKKGIEKE